MRYLPLILFLFIHFVHTAQNFRFKEYSNENGLPQNFIYAVNQDSRGYLWIGTGEGIYKFDGKGFSSLTTKDGLAEDIIVSSFLTPNDELWVGHNIGQLSKISNGKIISYSNPKLLQSTVTGISAFKAEVLFVTLNEGLFEIKDNKIEKIGKFGGQGFKKIIHLNVNNLLIATNNGLLHLRKKGSNWVKASIVLNDLNITAIGAGIDKNTFYVGSEEGKVHRITYNADKLSVKPWSTPGYPATLPVRSILQDREGNLWIGTSGAGLIKVRNPHESSPEITIFDDHTGLKGEVVETVFQDREGGIWIGTFGAGLSSLVDDFFTFFTPMLEDQPADVTAIYANQQYRWFGTQRGLLRTSILGVENDVLYNEKNGLVADRITSLYRSGQRLFIGTQTEGLFIYDLKTHTVKRAKWPLGNLNNKIVQITGNEDYLWIATRGGLVSFDLETAETAVFGTSNGLAHNSILSVYKDKTGSIWLGTISRSIFKISDNGIEEIQIARSGQLEIISITEDKKGNIWLASAESGIFKISGTSVERFTTQNGLKSNYCYSIATDPKGNIWVGHRGALSRVSPLKNEIATFDHTYGINGQINRNATFIDRDSYLWIGSEYGAIRYDSRKDKRNSIPPIANIVRVWIDDTPYPIDQEIKLPYGNYRIRFEYVGVCFKNAEKVTYQYMLEGYDGVRSMKSLEDYTTYGKISDGEYTFKVSAFNEAGFESTEPATISISIAKPFWKQIWFILLAIGVFFFGIYFVIQNRTARLRKSQNELQRRLNIKTKEVVEKAKRIESINKDLTDSISYAEHIQQSILPDVSQLKEWLPNSFIFFLPRDVVSGDFYFIKRIENKLIIACADCTGHGVPGAFVSMIGSVTLKNIYDSMRHGWKNPDQVLAELDREVKQLLQGKSIKKERSTDGMDLALLEVNLDTNEVLLSSAKRQSIINQNGEVTKLKGVNRSIGDDNNNETAFELHRFQMQKGDSIYLFTDGYTDQFGGPNNKKLKISGTIEMVKELEDINRIHHENVVKKRFLTWQGDVEQIDDVLFIGLLF